MFYKKEKALFVVILIYLLCFLFRILEYFILRTDQTLWGEAFVHKLIGIVILIIVIKILRITPKQVGFIKERTLYNLLKGIIFGLFIFALAYSAEIITLEIYNKFKTLDLYVSVYTIGGNTGNQTAALYFAICIIGNIINVIMEECIFRGLFPKILQEKYSFIVSSVIASILFGIWHIMAPVRNYCDGIMSLGGFIAYMIMLILTSSLVGFKFAMMTKITGSLYMAMGDHFVNNTITNVLHVVSVSGADELMVLRISIAQSLSFVIVLIWFFSFAKRSSCGVSFSNNCSDDIL